MWTNLERRIVSAMTASMILGGPYQMIAAACRGSKLSDHHQDKRCLRLETAELAA